MRYICVTLVHSDFHNPFLDQFRYLDVVVLHEHHMSIAMYPNLPQLDMFHTDTSLSQVVYCAIVIYCVIACFRGHNENWYLHQIYEFACR